MNPSEMERRERRNASQRAYYARNAKKIRSQTREKYREKKEPSMWKSTTTRQTRKYFTAEEAERAEKTRRRAVYYAKKIYEGEDINFERLSPEDRKELYILLLKERVRRHGINSKDKDKKNPLPGKNVSRLNFPGSNRGPNLLNKTSLPGSKISLLPNPEFILIPTTIYPEE